MWVTVYLCGSMFGQMDCVRIQEMSKPKDPVACFLSLPYAWRTVYSFKLQHPEYRDYDVIYKECSTQAIVGPGGEEI